MDLPAFALHAEPLRRKFYRPKSVLVRLLTQLGSYICDRCVFGNIKFAASGLRRALASTRSIRSRKLALICARIWSVADELWRRFLLAASRL